jgi:hypothetical protein
MLFRSLSLNCVISLLEWLGIVFLKLIQRKELWGQAVSHMAVIRQASPVKHWEALTKSR